MFVWATSLIPSLGLPYGVIVSKNLYFYLATSLCLLTLPMLHKRPLENKMSFSFTSIDILIICLYLFSLLRLSLTPSASFLHAEFLNSSFLLILYFLFKQAIPKHLSSLLYALLFFASIQIIYSLSQLIGFAASLNSFFPVTGSFVNTAPLAGFIISFLPILIAFSYSNYKNQKSMGELFWMTILVVSALLILAVTASRAAWFALLIGSVPFLIQLKPELKNKRVVTSAVLIFSLLLIPLYFINTHSADGRIFIWNNTTSIIKDHFLWGSGYETFNVTYCTYQVKYFLTYAHDLKHAYLADVNDFAFNEFLKLFSEQGVCAFSLFSLLLYNLYNKNNLSARSENDRYLYYGTIGSLFSLTIFALFSYPFSILPIQMHWVFLVAIISSFKAETHVKLSVSPILRKITRATTIGFALATIWFTLESYNNYKQWQLAKNLVSANKLKKARNAYDKLFPSLKHEGLFLYEYGTAQLKTGEYKKSIRTLSEAKKKCVTLKLCLKLAQAYEKNGDYKKAEAEYLYVTWLVPHLLYPKYLLVQLYIKTGEQQKALHLAQAILTIKPKVASDEATSIQKQMKEYLLSTKI